MGVNNNVESLRDHLFDTLNKLSKGTIEFEEANAVSKVSDSIMQTVKVELEFAKMTGIPPKIGFLENFNTKKLKMK